MAQSPSKNNDIPFYTSIKTNYDYIFPLNGKQVAFVKKRVACEASILDIGCATGSLLIALSSQGFSTRGIDLDDGLLEIANQKISAIECRAKVEKLNMLKIHTRFGANAFDCISCFGNTLSHLPQIQLQPFFHNVYMTLRSGGVFCGQIINYDRLVALNLSALPTIDNSNVQFIRTYKNFDGIHPFQFHTELTDKANHSHVENNITLYPLSATILRKNLQEAGFTQITFMGSFEGAEADNTKMPLIFTAGKTACEK